MNHPDLPEGNTITLNRPTPRKIFTRGCCGIALQDRGVNDNHVCFSILSEDDEHWFIGSSYSSYWLDDLQYVITKAEEWIRNNCIEDSDRYGWSFKS